MPKLEGHVAIITGAAGGQGRAEAALFLAEGAAVVMTDLDAVKGAAAAEKLGGKSLFLPHDVASDADWQRVVQETLAQFGRVDILINNAGVYRPQSLQETSSAMLDLHYRVNVLGPFLGMQAVHPAMLDQGGGAIVNVASAAGLRGFPGMLAYASSKWMVRGLSKCAALDLAASNIRVNTILPGMIDTEMLASNPPGFIEAMKQRIPKGRLGRADEIARAALYLASDEASYVVGTELTVCGGLGI